MDKTTKTPPHCSYCAAHTNSGISVGCPNVKGLAQLAQEALDVQDACNLTGVLHSAARAGSALRELLRDAGTDTINHHPILVLWADKIAHLTGTQSGNDRVTAAYSEVYKIVEAAKPAEPFQPLIHVHVGDKKGY